MGDPVGLGWSLLVVFLYFACSYILLGMAVISHVHRTVKFNHVRLRSWGNLNFSCTPSMHCRPTKYHNAHISTNTFECMYPLKRYLIPDYYLSVCFLNISTLKGILTTLKGWELLILYNQKLLKLKFSASCAVYFKLNNFFRTSDSSPSCIRELICYLPENLHRDINYI